MRLRSAILVVLLLPGAASFADHPSGGFGGGSAAPILTQTAVPQQSGSWIIGIRTELVHNKAINPDRLIVLRGTGINRDGEADEDLHSIDSILGVSINASYGVTEDLSVGLRLPYIRRNNILEPEAGHGHNGNPVVVHDIIDHGDTSGIGDMTLFGIYRFHQHHDLNVALLFGIKAPTGKTDETGFEGEFSAQRFQTSVLPPGGDDHHHNGTRLETHQQPGSGSWDGLAGLAFSNRYRNINLDANILYTLVTEGDQQTDLGDGLFYNVAVSRPLSMFAPCASCSWDVVLELNGEYRERETRSGQEIGNSGGHLLYLSPGLRLNLGEQLGLSLSVGVPLLRDLNGDQSEPRYRVIGGLNYSF